MIDAAIASVFAFGVKVAVRVKPVPVIAENVPAPTVTSSLLNVVSGSSLNLNVIVAVSPLFRLVLSLVIVTVTLNPAIDQTIVGTAEPHIIAQLSGFDRYPWVATLYLLTSTVAVPIFASLSDRFGRKPFFMSGVVIFVLASALCGAAGNLTFLPFDGMGQLIAFRGLQGLGAGIITGVLFTIVGDIFSPQERGKYQGLFAEIGRAHV